MTEQPTDWQFIVNLLDEHKAKTCFNILAEAIEVILDGLGGVEEEQRYINREAMKDLMIIAGQVTKYKPQMAIHQEFVIATIKRAYEIVSVGPSWKKIYGKSQGTGE